METLKEILTPDTIEAFKHFSQAYAPAFAQAKLLQMYIGMAGQVFMGLCFGTLVIGGGYTLFQLGQAIKEDLR